MITMNYKQVLIIGISIISSISFVQAQQLNEQIQLKWRTAPTYNGKDNLNLQLILKNISNRPVDLSTWDLWFNSMFPIAEKKTTAYQFSNENGNLFKVQFAGQIISPKDSLLIDYVTQVPIVNVSTVPNGFYFQNKIDAPNYLAINDVVYETIKPSLEARTSFNSALYAKNNKLIQASSFPVVFPTPQSIQLGKGTFTLGKSMSFWSDKSFDNEKFISSELSSILGPLVPKGTASSAQVTVKRNSDLGDEAYTLDINKKGVQITANTNKGVFYALQSLRSMQPVKSAAVTTSVVELPFVSIKDAPRFGYRGFMLDIVRNYRDKETILKYLDIMAAYKLNVFHFHLIDDEGWRIEIPSLPELVEIGAHRSPTYADGNSIHPAYGSGASDTARHYLTRTDFIEILKYAKDRYITVVPEIETPGHSRAAIKAMETRYHRLMAQGKVKEAEMYLLHDFDDASVYNSAQNFNDNILNPALPSVYTFIEKVLDEFKSMYVEAGVDFKKVSLGGDEVPNGVWEKSPKILQLMKEKGFTSVHQVWPYYISRINETCASKGLKMAGWEEIGMVNKGQGMVVNHDLADKQNTQVDVWNNVIGGGHEDLAYRLANAGYPTVLISSSNLYFDMMWNTNFTEPGLKWATYADLYHSYSFLPEDYFANIDQYYSGKALGKNGFKDRVRLTEEGKKNMLGIKGGLFAETVHTDEKLDYMVFPRFFVLAERAWSPKKSYESERDFSVQAFDQDYQQFVQRIGQVDLPKLANQVAFRLPAVGVIAENGMILANVEYPNFTIFYTTDGSIPSLQSKVYDVQKGVKIEDGQQYVFAVVDQNGRVGQLTYFN